MEYCIEYRAYIYTSACHIIPENTVCSAYLWPLVVHALLHLINYKMNKYIFVRRAGESFVLNIFIDNMHLFINALHDDGTA